MGILDSLQYHSIKYSLRESLPTLNSEPLGFQDLVPLERVLLLAIFLILFIPPAKRSENTELDKQKNAILKLSALAGTLAIAMRFIRMIYLSKGP